MTAQWTMKCQFWTLGQLEEAAHNSKSALCSNPKVLTSSLDPALKQLAVIPMPSSPHLLILCLGPFSSTAPWQIEGLQKLASDGGWRGQ